MHDEGTPTATSFPIYAKQAVRHLTCYRFFSVSPFVERGPSTTPAQRFLKRVKESASGSKVSLRNDVLVSDAEKDSFKGKLDTFIFYITHRLVWITCCINWLH